MHYLHFIAVSGVTINDAYAKAKTLLEAGLTLSDGGFDYYTILGSVSEDDRIHKKTKDFNPEHKTTELIKNAVLRWIKNQTSPERNQEGIEALKKRKGNIADITGGMDFFYIKEYINTLYEFEGLLDRMDIEKPPASIEYFTGEDTIANAFNIFEHSWRKFDFAANGLTVGSQYEDETKYIVFVDCHR